jgi:hypothetical protein
VVSRVGECRESSCSWLFNSVAEFPGRERRQAVSIESLRTRVIHRSRQSISVGRRKLLGQLKIETKIAGLWQVHSGAGMLSVCCERDFTVPKLS